MSITRLLSICCLAIFSGTAVSVVLVPEIPALAWGWRMPEPPFGALVFALACALVLLPGRAGTPPSRPDPFND